jgi:succinyl-diaminopimelate desuccinylase
MSNPILDRLTALARELIRIPSTESRPEARAQCFVLCRRHLEKISGVELREYESRGFASLVACARGVEAPSILLVGHLDVIEHPGADVYQSAIRDGRIWGPGAGDMKGQCAIMLELFCELQRRFPGLPLGIALTSDEERGGEDGVRYLFETAGLRCGMAIVPDGGSIDRVTVEEKGIVQARLRVTGKEGHAAAPWLGPNALMTLTRCLVRLGDHFDALQDAASTDHWYPTFVPTICRTANQSINCIPADAEGVVDLRFPPPHTVESILATVQQIAGPEVSVELVASAPTTRLSPDPVYLRITEELTGRPASLVRASGGSDAWFIARYGIPVVLSSPLVGNFHREDEWMDLASMGLYYRICEQFIVEKLAPGIPQREP